MDREGLALLRKRTVALCKASRGRSLSTAMTLPGIFCRLDHKFRFIVHVGLRHTVLNQRCTASLVRAVPLRSAARRLPQSVHSGFMEVDTSLVRIVSHDCGYRGEIAKVRFKSRTPCPSLASSVVMHMSPSLRCSSFARRCEHQLQDHCASPRHEALSYCRCNAGAGEQVALRFSGDTEPARAVRKSYKCCARFFCSP